MYKLVNKIFVLQFVAIGPTTKKALEEMGFKVSATASKPTPENLADAISKILSWLKILAVFIWYCFIL